LTKHEGLRLRPYKCPGGKTTIGIGRNLDDNGITESEAIILLFNDTARTTKELQQALGPAFDDLNEARKIALIDMAFNLGITKFLKFEKMLRAIYRGDFDRASTEMLKSKWATQVGPRAQELAEIMKAGEITLTP